MNMYLSSDRDCADSFASAPVLIAAASEAATARARQSVAMAGFRCADGGDAGSIGDRLAQQAAATALWVELDDGDPAITDELVESVAAEMRRGRFPAIICAPESLLDRLASFAFEPSIEVLIDASPSERVAALALAAAEASKANSASDVTADKNAARLRQLSDEVSRIATTLARLSSGPAGISRPPQAQVPRDLPEVSIETVRAVVRARRLRDRYFTPDLFADPAWDMLLDLFQAEITRLRVPVSSLCIAAAVPATTALRWLKTMVEDGLFVRRADPHDGRRVFVELAPQTSDAMRRYFADIGNVGGV